MLIAHGEIGMQHGRPLTWAPPGFLMRQTSAREESTIHTTRDVTNLQSETQTNLPASRKCNLLSFVRLEEDPHGSSEHPYQ